MAIRTLSQFHAPAAASADVKPSVRAASLVPSSPVLLLHRTLGLGLSVATVALLALRYLDRAPQLRHEGLALVMAYTVTALNLAVAAVALLVVKRRRSVSLWRQLNEPAWSRPEIAAKALPVWLLLQGAGMIAAVSYFLTGASIAAAGAGLIVVTFWLCGPRALAGS